MPAAPVPDGGRRARILGLVFAGLGQMQQRRIAAGIAFLGAGLRLGWDAFMTWHACLNKTTGMPHLLPWRTLALLAVIWFGAWMDVRRGGPEAR
ncbi:hypothetical protein [Solimonas fluminis]|nr:hypothetical protein [Solimonas fluminis]